MNRPITSSLLALEVLMAVWFFSTSPNRERILSKEKVSVLESLIENALNGEYRRGIGWIIFDKVVIAQHSRFPFLHPKKDNTPTIEDEHLSKAFMLLVRAIDFSIDALEADRKSEPTALNLALFALSSSSEFIGMWHGIMDYRQEFMPNHKVKPTIEKGRHNASKQVKTHGLAHYNELRANGITSNVAKTKTAIKFGVSNKMIEDWVTEHNQAKK